MRDKTRVRTHVTSVSKSRPRIAAPPPACDGHESAKNRKKCDKGKIDPPNWT